MPYFFWLRFLFTTPGEISRILNAINAERQKKVTACITIKFAKIVKPGTIMNDIIKKREISCYEADRNTVIKLLSEDSEIKYFDVICVKKDGGLNYLTDNFISFPFSLESEIKILLNDALDYYTNIIEQIKNEG